MCDSGEKRTAKVSDGFCDQSTFENLKESLSGTRDLLDSLQWELRDRTPLPGEDRLVDELVTAIEALVQCCNRVEANAVEELQWGQTVWPQRVMDTPAALEDGAAPAG